MMRHLGLLLGLLLCAGGCGSASFEESTTSGESIGSSEGSLSASGRPGMGSVVFPGGVTFRVWAPNAQRVWVTGDFNGWGWSELGNEFNGNFSMDYWGAHKGQRYKYILRNHWGSDAWKADPRGQRMENSTGSSIIHDPASYSWASQWFQTPQANELVIYEMHVGTFHDAPGGGPGNWHSAVAKLDYLRDLGVNAVEVMPMMEFPGDFSWGYNPAWPFAAESAYGSPDDLKWFIDEAHERGIAVLFDVVHNHYGPSDLGMWCFSGDCQGAGGEYFYSDWRSATPWGNTRPNYGRTEVRNYIKDQAMMLLHEYRADGLRWDATKFMRTTDGNESNAIADAWHLFRVINDEVDATQPWKLMIAEDFGAGNAITGSTASGGAGFDSQWGGEFVHPVRSAIITPYDSDRNMYSVRDALTQRFNGSAMQRVIYTESHDEVANGKARVPEEISPGNAGSWVAKKRSTLGAAITFTAPGIPMLFQGQEFVEDGFFAAEDPLDWNKAGYFSGITQLYRDLIKLRRNWFNNTRGLRGENINVFHVNNTQKVIGYHRWQQGGPGDDVVVIANFSGQWLPDYRVGLPRGGLWYVRFNSDWNGYSPDFGNTASLDTTAHAGAYDGLPYNASFALGPYSAIILSQ